MKQTITYHYRGRIGVHTRNGYEWRDGYSADSATGGVLYPWETKAQCRRDAAAQGKRAVFVDAFGCFA